MDISGNFSVFSNQSSIIVVGIFYSEHIVVLLPYFHVKMKFHDCFLIVCPSIPRGKLFHFSFTLVQVICMGALYSDGSMGSQVSNGDIVLSKAAFSEFLYSSPELLQNLLLLTLLQILTVVHAAVIFAVNLSE